MASATIFFASRSALRRARLANLAQHVGGVGVRLLFQAADQLVLRVLRRHAGHLLQPAALVRDQLVELLLARLHQLFAAPEVAGALADLAVALLDELELPVEHALALGHAALLQLDRRPPRTKVLLRGLAQLHHLFLAGDDSALTRRLDLALGVGDDALRRFLGRGFRGGLAFDLGFSSDANSELATEKEKSRQGDDERAQRGIELPYRSFDICSTADGPREKGYHRRTRGAPPGSRSARGRADVGRDMERANYKGRFNLREQPGDFVKVRAS